MEKIKTKARLKLFFIGFMMISISSSCSWFSLSEDDARNTAKRFFNMKMMKNLDEKEMDKLYPTFYQMGSWIIFENVCVINNISKNSDGQYEVYASYKPNNLISYPIYLLIGGSKSKPIILASKGVNYAYYDKVFEYGKKIGALKGNENDVDMSKIIQDKSLSKQLDLIVEMKISNLYNNLKTKSNLRLNSIGYVSGYVSIINNNNFNFENNFQNSDIQLRIDFLDKNNRITFSTNETFYEELRPFGSISKKLLKETNNSERYKITTILNSDRVNFRNRIKDLVIQEKY
jgi:hypothetical protein